MGTAVSVFVGVLFKEKCGYSVRHIVEMDGAYQFLWLVEGYLIQLYSGPVACGLPRNSTNGAGQKRLLSGFGRQNVERSCEGIGFVLYIVPCCATLSTRTKTLFSFAVFLVTMTIWSFPHSHRDKE